MQNETKPKSEVLGIGRKIKSLKGNEYIHIFFTIKRVPKNIAVVPVKLQKKKQRLDYFVFETKARSNIDKDKSIKKDDPVLTTNK